MEPETVNEDILILMRSSEVQSTCPWRLERRLFGKTRLLPFYQVADLQSDGTGSHTDAHISGKFFHRLGSFW